LSPASACDECATISVASTFPIQSRLRRELQFPAQSAALARLLRRQAPVPDPLRSVMDAFAPAEGSY
jgi:hypothetical protein